MSKISKEDIINKLREEAIQEVLAPSLDFKSSWRQGHGEDISAIANHHSREGGWLIIGVNDHGKLLNKDLNWLKETEQQVSNHVSEYLEPNLMNIFITGEEISGNHILLIEIIPPDDVVYWNGKAYKLIGTHSEEMTPPEILELTLSLPGHDFSKANYHGSVNSSLVMSFAQKLTAVSKDLFENTENLTATDVLNKLGIKSKNVSGILFGDFIVRIVHCDINGDILDQHEQKGLYGILDDKFIEEIQSWTRRQGTVLISSFTAKEEEPYPISALRESIANAVAHAFYSKDQGDIVIEMFPNRIVISNNCSLDAELFVDKWFSRINSTKNKLLMHTLRISKLTDELGSGKNRIFRHMIEQGKREPIIEFEPFKTHARWKTTLYNEDTNMAILNLIERLKQYFKNPDEWRIAIALVLWRDKAWSEIINALDEHYKRIANTVIESSSSPVIRFEEKLMLKRWAKAVFDGQQTIKFTSDEEKFYFGFLYSIFL